MTTEEDASTYIPHNELDDMEWLSASAEETELLEVAVWGSTKPLSFEETPLVSLLRHPCNSLSGRCNGHSNKSIGQLQ